MKHPSPKTCEQLKKRCTMFQKTITIWTTCTTCIFIFRSHYNEKPALTVKTLRSATLTYDRFYPRGRMMRLDEPCFEIRLERRTTKGSSSGRIMRLVPVFDLATERERQLTTAPANQTTGLTNGRAANWAPEVVFSPFRALSRRQLTFPSCC